MRAPSQANYALLTYKQFGVKPMNHDLKPFLVQVVLNPQPQLTDMPLKSYYRYALPTFAPPEKSDSEWEGDGEEQQEEEEGLLGPPEPPAAIFSGLPGAS